MLTLMLPHRMPLTDLLVPPRPSSSRRIGIVSISDLAERDGSLVGQWIVEELCPSASRRKAWLANPSVHRMGPPPATTAPHLPAPLRHPPPSVCQRHRLRGRGLQVKNKTGT